MCIIMIVRCHSDGTISYDEMLQYFLSANSLLRERFTHRFEEHTFLGTAVCEHCKGMVRASVCVCVCVPCERASTCCCCVGTDEGHREARREVQGLRNLLPQAL